MKIVILVKKIRKFKNMSVLKLSELSGVSHTEIERIESGEVSPTLDTMLKLAIALNVNIYETFTTNDNKRE